jgi:hypothetical protein
MHDIIILWYNSKFNYCEHASDLLKLLNNNNFSRLYKVTSMIDMLVIAFYYIDV